uniref:Uncharacterized protein n=1 Tax=Arundo donax TaxID=35708 RepID=A0A0A9CW08_ARUDO
MEVQKVVYTEPFFTQIQLAIITFISNHSNFSYSFI